MARPRLEVANPQLAGRALHLAMQIGIKPAAYAVGISKNTMRALLRRNDLNWLAMLRSVEQ